MKYPTLICCGNDCEESHRTEDTLYLNCNVCGNGYQLIIFPSDNDSKQAIAEKQLSEVVGK